MTAPAGAVADITSRIASIQAVLAGLSAPAPATSPAGAAAASSALAGTSGSFAAQFASATGGAAATGPVATASGGVTGSAAVTQAERYLGTPYVWGGESHGGIDCSGLTQASYKALGIDIPRVAADQAHAGTAVPSLAQAQPGDLLFFGNPAYHVAMYLGNNRLIESPEPGRTVHITDVYQTPTSIRRIVPESVAPIGGVVPAAATSTGLSAAAIVGAGLNPAVANYADSFAAAEARHHLPTGLLAAVAQQESGGNARAVSPAGAEGLMQLMPSTAAGMGVDPYDAGQAIDAAARILSSSLSRYGGSVPLALAAYNAGPGAVAQYGGIPPYSETQNYVRSITAMMAAGG